MLIVPINKIKIFIDKEPLSEANAIIITSTGEIVDNFILHQGTNVIDVSAYIDKNYSIKIIHGDNISVQKI
ncbi:MAG: hypothetical protein LC122_09735 [Chitinophagales bacterium]|nr:hypothetical protein [Chitinophagales bacterium]